MKNNICLMCKEGKLYTQTIFLPADIYLEEITLGLVGLKCDNCGEMFLNKEHAQASIDRKNHLKELYLEGGNPTDWG